MDILIYQKELYESPDARVISLSDCSHIMVTSNYEQQDESWDTIG